MDIQIDYDFIIKQPEIPKPINSFSSVCWPLQPKMRKLLRLVLIKNLNYYYTIDEKNIFALEAKYLIKNENPFYNAILVNNPEGSDSFDNTAIAFGPNTILPSYNLGQNRLIKSNQLDAKLDYYYIINGKSNQLHLWNNCKPTRF